MSRWLCLIVSAIGVATAPLPVRAQEATTGGDVKIPDLTFKPDPEVIKNYWKYNYFHKAGVDYATALADVRECRLRSAITGLGGLSGFVPYGDATGGTAPRANVSPAIGGLVGGLIAGAVVDSLVERNHRANLRFCMGAKGYRQYGLPKELWRQINPDDAALGDRIQAGIASGPTPATEPMP